ncbi:MAG: hypothetical protein U1E36_03330 [Rickettsiales bacterium]
MKAIAGFLALILAALTAFYYYELSFDRKLKITGRAYTNAVNIAFGQEWYLESLAKFSLDDNSLQACVKMHPDDGHCRLTRGNFRFYTNFCAWWRLEKCMVVAADPIFLNDLELGQKLEQVIATPCKFLPNENTIRSNVPLIETKLNMLAPSSRWNLKDYLYYRQALGCDNPDTANIKVYLVFFDKEKMKSSAQVQENGGVVIGLKYPHTTLLNNSPKIIISKVGAGHGE